MKTMKKLFALLLAVLMVMGMATTAVAATNPLTITITNETDGHSYEAYQIFTGTLDSTSGIFTNVEWGDGVDEKKLIDELQKSTLFGTTFNDISKTDPDATAVAKILGGWSYNETPVKNFADVVNTCLTDTKQTFAYDPNNKNYTTTVTAFGYYFIKEVKADGSSDLDHVDGYTDYLLAVTNSTVINPKNSKPSFELTVDYRENGAYGKGVDVQVGDPIYIRMTSKLPELYADYHQYYLKYELELPTGIVFPADSDKLSQVLLLHGDGTTTSAAADRYTVTYEGNKVSVVIHDLKKGTMNLNDTLVFKTKAIMQDPTVFGKGAENTFGNVINGTMFFSNDMNEKDAASSNIDTVSHAKMTDQASVYTYQVKFQKVDSLTTTTTLEGAEFKLYRNITTETTVEGEKTTTTTAMYAKVNNDGVITGWTEKAGEGSTVRSDSNGNFIFKGVDAAAYHLEEVTAPTKYNKMEEPVLVTISATITGNNLEKLSCIADGSTTNGEVKTGLIENVLIKNTLGSTLPATGGIGTTIFYIVGGVLVLGAGAAFVMKRRNEA